MKNKNNKSYLSNGFTLIELMVVIAIILILSGFLLPKLMGYQQKARNAKAVNTARQIQTAAMSSYGEEDGKFVKDDVLNNINSLTVAEGVEIADISDQAAAIDFSSDGKNYCVEVDASNNKYVVKDDKKNVIYPKVLD